MELSHTAKSLFISLSSYETSSDEGRKIFRAYILKPNQPGSVPIKELT